MGATTVGDATRSHSFPPIPNERAGDSFPFPDKGTSAQGLADVAVEAVPPFFRGAQ